MLDLFSIFNFSGPTGAVISTSRQNLLQMWCCFQKKKKKNQNKHRQKKTCVLIRVCGGEDEDKGRASVPSVLSYRIPGWQAGGKKPTAQVSASIRVLAVKWGRCRGKGQQEKNKLPSVHQKTAGSSGSCHGLIWESLSCICMWIILRQRYISGLIQLWGHLLLYHMRETEAVRNTASTHHWHRKD